MPETVEIGNQAAAAANIFIDPGAAVRRMTGRWPWLLPFVLICVVNIVASLLLSPISMRIMQMNPPEGIQPDQLEKSLGFIALIQKLTIVVAPVMLLLKMAVLGGLMTGLSSMMDVKATFKQMFTLVGYCSLIPMLQTIATAVVVLAKASQLQNMQELQPPFGLDLLLTETSKPVWAILNYFSLFTVWYLVILAFAYSIMTGSSKAKAVLAITPAWIIPLLFAVLGSLFQR